MSLYSGYTSDLCTFDRWAKNLLGFNIKERVVWQGTKHYMRSPNWEENDRLIRSAIKELTKEYGKPLTKDMDIEFDRRIHGTGWESITLRVKLN